MNGTKGDIAMGLDLQDDPSPRRELSPSLSAMILLVGITAVLASLLWFSNLGRNRQPSEPACLGPHHYVVGPCDHGPSR